MLVERLELPGSAHRELGGNVAHLHPEQAVFEAMLAGWAGQQSARLLSVITVGQRESVLRRFAHFTGTWPWQWTPADVEDWASALRSGHPRRPDQHRRPRRRATHPPRRRRPPQRARHRRRAATVRPDPGPDRAGPTVSTES